MLLVLPSPCLLLLFLFCRLIFRLMPLLPPLGLVLLLFMPSLLLVFRGLRCCSCCSCMWLAGATTPRNKQQHLRY